MRVGGDDGGLRPWHYIYVYSIESRLMMRVTPRYHGRNSVVAAMLEVPQQAYAPTVGLCLGSYGGSTGEQFLMSKVPLRLRCACCQESGCRGTSLTRDCSPVGPP